MPSVLTAVLMSMSVVGCIKENREACPCLLVVDFSEIDRNESDSLHLGVFSPDGILCAGKFGNDCYGNRFCLEVPKSVIGLNVFSFSPVEDRFAWEDFEAESGTVMRIPPGCECPPVYTYFSKVDTRKETHVEYVRPLKNFCRLSIIFRADDVAPYHLSVQGNICGYYRDGELMQGDFHFSPDISDEGRCRVRIPRQKDGSMSLSVDDGSGVVRRFSLGNYLIQSGYDWSEPSLRDAEIIIDYATMQIAVKVDDWDAVFIAEVMI